VIVLLLLLVRLRLLLLVLLVQLVLDLVLPFYPSLSFTRKVTLTATHTDTVTPT